MHFHRRRGWEIPEREATPRHLVLNRRALMAAAGAGAMLSAEAQAQWLFGGRSGSPSDPWARNPGDLPDLPEAMRNPRYQPGRAVSPERDAITFNNFYEFGSNKDIWPTALRMPVRPWTIRVDGMVEAPGEFGVDDLIRRIGLEERVYRLRCVEAWAMTVPWTGFQLSKLLDIVKPLGSAKYVRLETAQVPPHMTGLRQTWYPWPHIEGCTIEEAANELTFMPVGLYGRPLPPQNGGPFRVVFPWKYGFKSGKSLSRITLTDQRPKSFWETLQGNEYGFWANVNPDVPHPRWSQATERLIGTNERVPTRIFNGYGEFVADLYTNLQRERLWA
ncbi:protein-methionine-sulfoxide reductase catalytic subunit MsrP [Falsiroseomonas oryzae]|uniref:protein-methionine-sulfoxide reductase catalytic subunit MsrP n=1 Tax=Falsiroseomonas oryzae TaxID=2766473 RepID=UPI0022EA509A|nr:protein-methionine-sulfoxide reductase catalytic subunit MsrP [Roseomonas sp. MO-31]